MDRPIQYTQAQLRTYDLLSGWKDALIALGNLSNDVYGSPSSAVASGFVPSYNGNLTITFGTGRLYQVSVVDATNYSVLAADSTLVLQQGQSISQTLTFSTAGLTSGQSLYALVEGTYSQSDVIASDDPSNGLLTYFNPSNPTAPYLGPGGLGTANTTVRQGLASLQIKYGTAAATGSQVPPTPDPNYTPLYLVLLTFGQTAINGTNVFISGPSVATGVPSNYPYAPFIAGLLNSHHNGNPGQAPKIKLTSEVQGILPLGNLPATGTTGNIPTIQVYAGNPNGNVAGTAQALVWDSTDSVMWTCTTTGTATTAVWARLSNNIVLVTTAPTLIGTFSTVGAWVTINSTAPTGASIATVKFNIGAPISGNTAVYIRYTGSGLSFYAGTQIAALNAGDSNKIITLQLPLDGAQQFDIYMAGTGTNATMYLMGYIQN